MNDVDPELDAIKKDWNIDVSFFEEPEVKKISIGDFNISADFKDMDESLANGELLKEALKRVVFTFGDKKSTLSDEVIDRVLNEIS